jgi:hypothetical protein
LHNPAVEGVGRDGIGNTVPENVVIMEKRLVEVFEVPICEAEISNQSG